MKGETLDECNILLEYKKENLIYLSLNFVFFHKDFHQSQTKLSEICIKFVFFFHVLFFRFRNFKNEPKSTTTMKIHTNTYLR